MLAERNADGLPQIKPTEEQKYLFDTRGWLLIPGVLAEDAIVEMREFCYRLVRDRESIPEAERSSIGGPLLQLTDHPALLGFLNEFVADPYGGSETAYGFRLEATFLTIRAAGHDNFSPHGGSGSLALGHNSHVYRYLPNRVFSGLTRAVWELNPVRKGDGGTLFLSGSHKAAFPAPASIHAPDSPLWEDYECPPGSLLLFTEGITHSGARWTNPEVNRVAIFNCYNTIGWRWHDERLPHPDALAAMHPLRRSLFRKVCCQNNTE